VLGADPVRPLDWPHPGGESSSAVAPAAPWSSASWLSKRAYPRPWGGAWGTNAWDTWKCI
jgi:hypothetical protein